MCAVEELEEWDPLKSDFTKPTNSYDIPTDDPEMAVVGYKSHPKMTHARENHEEMTQKIGALIRENTRTTIRELVEETGVSYGTCQKILTEDLGLERKFSKFVQKNT
ncbi:hypothetical protein LAZ67_23000425 [Cordylochernes scorpioides]|uniref:Uncharacterized protein n=1 Tax=Cordylochernes scorpioides TaxID=51811 RepID=A0ABY6LPZ6_9ARAC|nr:hypothetical protein LAZ67_23000425 [Cordylochernes scorpioides]